MAMKKWTYETCKLAALNCRTLKDFVRSYVGAYHSALKNGWLSNFEWLKREKKRDGYWEDYDRCFTEARKYNSRTAFQKGCSAAYAISLKNGWIKNYNWFVAKEELCREGRIKWTYTACWELASKCKTRSDFKRKSYGAWAAAHRNHWIDKYSWLKNEGLKWDYESCFNLAKDCHTLTEMAKRSCAAYDQARRNGWVKEYYWFVPTSEARRLGLMRSGIIKWDYDKVRKAALKCETLQDFSKRYASAYQKALKLGWIDDFEWLVRGQTPFEINRDCVYAYFFPQTKAVYVGRSVDCHRRDKEHHEGGAKDAVSRFAFENKISVPPMTILKKNLSLVDGKAWEHKYVAKYKAEGWHILNRGKTGIRSGSLGSLGCGKWNYETCVEEAMKYRTLAQFTKGSPSAYNAARKNKWLSAYQWLTREKGKWTFEAVYAEARKYLTLSAFKRGNIGAFDKAQRKGWLKEFYWFHRSQEWSYERCYAEAQKCETRVDFKNKCLGGYSKAVHTGWIHDYVWLKPNRRAQKAVVQMQQCGAVIRTYESIHEAARCCRLQASGIVGCLKGRYQNSGGYIWRYIEDVEGLVCSDNVKKGIMQNNDPLTDIGVIMRIQTI